MGDDLDWLRATFGRLGTTAESFRQGYDVSVRRVGDVAKPDLLSSGTSHLRLVSELQEVLPFQALELRTQRVEVGE
jgi:hypothetical protein